MDHVTAAMQKIRDATDNSGGATFPSYMLGNMQRWERQGLLELHYVGSGERLCARITQKVRARANGQITMETKK